MGGMCRLVIVRCVYMWNILLYYTCVGGMCRLVIVRCVYMWNILLYYTCGGAAGGRGVWRW